MVIILDPGLRRDDKQTKYTGGFMKRILFSLFILPLLIFISSPSGLAQEFLQFKVVKIGDPVPEFELKDTDGNLVKRSDFKGSILMVVFWSANCPFSVRYDPRINKIVKDYKNKGVVVLGIDSNQNESLEEINKAREERNVQYSISLDPGNLIANQYGAITTPHVFIIDKSGLLVYEGSVDDQGWSDQNPISNHYARAALDATLTDEPINTPVTKPFGCTIKREI
ncbi:MAG: redoxin domain-containing protein [Candidatus Omnitrophica bacterium]|nr:redoxin domain-containing protein [Candidatus Omnitrophota bacterium]